MTVWNVIHSMHKKRKSNPATFTLRHTLHMHAPSLFTHICSVSNVRTCTCTVYHNTPPSLPHTHTDILSHMHSVRKLICQIVIFSCSFKDLAQSSLAQSRSRVLRAISVRAPDLPPAASLPVICVMRAIDQGCASVKVIVIAAQRSERDRVKIYVRVWERKLSDIKMICCYVHTTTLATECDNNNSNLCPLLEKNGWSWYFLVLKWTITWLWIWLVKADYLQKKGWLNKMRKHDSNLVYWPYAESTAGFCLRVVAKTSTKNK